LFLRVGALPVRFNTPQAVVLKKPKQRHQAEPLTSQVIGAELDVDLTLFSASQLQVVDAAPQPSPCTRRMSIRKFGRVGDTRTAEENDVPLFVGLDKSFGNVGARRNKLHRSFPLPFGELAALSKTTQLQLATDLTTQYCMLRR
jgi:hypothetical protein